MVDSKDFFKEMKKLPGLIGLCCVCVGAQKYKIDIFFEKKKKIPEIIFTKCPIQGIQSCKAVHLSINNGIIAKSFPILLLAYLIFRSSQKLLIRLR